MDLTLRLLLWRKKTSVLRRCQNNVTVRVPVACVHIKIDRSNLAISSQSLFAHCASFIRRCNKSFEKWSSIYFFCPVCFDFDGYQWHFVVSVLFRPFRELRKFLVLCINSCEVYYQKQSNNYVAMKLSSWPPIQKYHPKVESEEYTSQQNIPHVISTRDNWIKWKKPIFWEP